MHKLWNWLFGWDYVHIQTHIEIITTHSFWRKKRIKKDKVNRAYVETFGDIYFLSDVPEKDLVWLTCEPLKYLNGG